MLWGAHFSEGFAERPSTLDGVSDADIDAIAPAMLPESFDRTEPPDPV
jgi:hypothetical protein